MYNHLCQRVAFSFCLIQHLSCRVSLSFVTLGSKRVNTTRSGRISHSKPQSARDELALFEKRRNWLQAALPPITERLTHHLRGISRLTQITRARRIPTPSLASLAHPLFNPLLYIGQIVQTSWKGREIVF